MRRVHNWYVHVLLAIVVGLVSACGAAVRRQAPWPPPALLAAWQQTCEAMWQEELGRAIDPEGLRGCLAASKAGQTAEDIRAGVRASLEYAELQARLKKPPVTPPTRVRTEGRFFVNDAGTFRPRFASALAILTTTPEDRALVLDEDVALGFNGVRVFAGRLPWAGQTLETVHSELPALLREAEARGLYVYVSAITESASGYDVEAHLRYVASECAAQANCLLEVANEVGHPTQSAKVNDPAWLLALARRVVPAGVPWTLGAALSTDEVDASGHYPTQGGPFDDAHLNRGRDKWNQVRRLREIAGISEATKRPAMSGEPIGAAEADVPGKRMADPAFFYAMGVLCRGFELGCVFHSDDGLAGHQLRPVQKACAEAFVAGWREMGTDERLAFKNARWADSPVKEADFNKVARAYSFVAGNHGWTALVGLTGDPAVRWGAGWTPGSDRSNGPVKVVEVKR